MKNKKLFLIMLVFTLIISMGTITAAETNNDTTTTTLEKTAHTTTDDNIETPTTKTINKQTKATKEAAQTVKNYTELYNNLTNPAADEDTTINLGGEEETYKANDTITVSEAIKNLVINGNGKTIDGQKTYGFLNITHACNLVINNLTIQNCNVTKETYDEIPTGAIVSRGGNIVINNTKMMDNIGFTSGAIHIEPLADSTDAYNVYILNSEFIKNIGNKAGSAIAYIGNEGSNLTIDNCTFNSNGNGNSLEAGGAVTISTKGTSTITNTNFESNHAFMGGAVALINDGKSTITNTTFKSNEGVGGGALVITNNGTLELSNTEFIENYADYGGAVYIISLKNLALNNVTFTSNYAENGSAIFQENGNGTTKISKSKFTNNTANNKGTITYTGIEGTSLEIYDTTFDQNGYNPEMGQTSIGGALAAKTNGTVKVVNSDFTNNIGTDCGGAIALYGYDNSTIEITNSNFTSNGINGQETYPAQCGGAVYIESIGNTTLNNNTFTRNQAQESGAVYYFNMIGVAPELRTNNTKFVVNNTLFDSNGISRRYGSTTNNGGALNIDSNNTVIIDNSTFISNMAQSDGGAIMYTGYDQNTLEIYNSNFDSNGKALYDSCRNGGAIHITTEGNTTIENTEFNNNNAQEMGGAIFYYANDNTNLKINNSKFNSNGKSLYQNTENGGALWLYTEGNITVTNTEFTSNKGTQAGAVYISQSNYDGNVIFDNTTFDSNGDKYNQNSYTGEGSAIYLDSEGNSSITNSKFTNNYGTGGTVYYVSENKECAFLVENTIFDSNGYSIMNQHTESGALTINSYNNVSIINSTFNSNIGCQGGALTLNTANVTITDSIFYKNGAFGDEEEMDGGTVYFDGQNDESNLIIRNSVFDSNSGLSGVALYLNNVNTSVTNTNFTNNVLNINGFNEGGSGIAIYSYESALSLNNTNFIGNGFPSNIRGDDIVGELEMDGGIIYFSSENKKFIIDHTNFIANRGGGEGGGIIHYYTDWNNAGNSTLSINHTTFVDNIIYGVEMEEIEIEGLVVYTYGNTSIDNTIFAYNKMGSLWGSEFEIAEEMSGVIYAPEYPCNVTNSVFIANTPANFIIKDDEIILNYSYYSVYEGKEYYDLMFDEYIPNYGNVTIFLDESETGTQYKLVSEMDDDKIKKVYVDGFEVNEDNYLIKMVVNQTEESQYYDRQLFHNNTYYFIMPHDYILSVNATSPIKVGDNTTITGKAYFLNSTGSEVTLKNRPVSLYINDTYIETADTDDNGEYEFQYTGEVIGTQNVTVAFNETIYLPRLTNTTTFDVVIRESVLNINVSETKIGEETEITFTLTDTEGNPIRNASIYFHVDNIEDNGTTNEEGIFIYNCKINSTGDNYVLAFYDGDYNHTKAKNSTIFEIKRLNTTITVTATNTTVNGKTIINGQLTDEKGNKIANAPIIIYIDEDTIYNKTDANGKFKFEYTITNGGENYVEVFYEGDNTYLDSINKTVFHAEKIKTIITVTAQNTTLGEKITIKGKLVDQNNKPIKNTMIILLVDNEEVDLNTTATGEFTYKYTAEHPNENYIEVFYEGNNTYKDSINSTIFMVNRINTTTTAKSVSNISGNVVLEVTVTGKDGKSITNGTLIILDKNGEIIGGHEISSKTTKVTLNNLLNGTHTLTIVYEGNNTYNPSNTTQKVKIIPEAKILIEVLNNTEGNVIIEYTVTDKNDNILKQQETTITLPNGSNTTRKTDNNGKIVLTDKTVKAGNHTTIAKIDTTNKIIGTTETKKITVIPDYQKIIDELKDTIKEQDKKIDDLEDMIDSKNKSTTIKVIPEDGTVGDTSIAVSIDNKLGEPIVNAPVTVKNSAGEVIGNGTTNKDGVVEIPVDTKAGTEKITVTYPGDKNNKAAKKTVTITTTKNKVLVTVDPVNGIIGENIKLTAHIKDTNGKAVSGGNLVFKLNGKTLRTDGSFNSTAPAWKFKVNNGKVTVTVKADLYLRNVKNLTASYSGTYKYDEAKSSMVTAQIKKRNAQLTVTAAPTKQKQYKTIAFTSTVKDTTPNAKNTTAINQDTYVLFKINGKTIKDTNGENLKVKVKNAKATYKYTVPKGMGGIDKEGQTRYYDVSSVLVSETFYPDTRNDTHFTVERSPVTINIGKVSVNSKNVLSVRASIKDYKNNKVIGTNQINIKINGKSYVNPKTKKTQNFQATNGTVNLKNIQLSKDITVKKITIVTGARQAYLGQRNETTNIVKV